MNDLESYILSKEANRVDREQLLAMGKRAASKYIDEDVSLNDAITEMAKEASLTDEQVKRVVEYANNATFNVLFKNTYDKNITFPMADSNSVLGGVRATKEKVAEVRMPTKSSKYIPGQEYVTLEGAFETSDDFEKNAEVLDVHAKTKEYLDLKQELSNLNSEKTVLSSALIDGLHSMKDMCKEAAADGYSPETVGAVIMHANPSNGLAQVIQEHVGVGLANLGSKDKLAMMGYSVQPANPMTGLTQDLESVSNKLISSQQAITRTQMAMTELLSVLRGSEIGGPTARLFNPPGGTPMMPAPAPEAPQTQAQAAPMMGANK
tara:strand:- start:977 stop:1939 length:963 start_codon:yes stop_codon:yes gene_type:complete